jgi:hypothetical protein
MQMSDDVSFYMLLAATVVNSFAIIILARRIP